jgi:two-component system, OmpR family, phosphate regulon response regulator PhoB
VRLGRKLRIGAIEFNLLSLFVTFPGRIFSREELVKLAWGEASCVDLRTVDVRIMRLRKALTVRDAPDPIRSIWGRGYKLNEFCEEEFQAWLASGKKKVRLKPVAPERRR